MSLIGNSISFQKDSLGEESYVNNPWWSEVSGDRRETFFNQSTGRALRPWVRLAQGTLPHQQNSLERLVVPDFQGQIRISQSKLQGDRGSQSTQTVLASWGRSSGTRWQLRCSEPITHRETALGHNPITAICSCAHKEYKVQRSNVDFFNASQQCVDGSIL